MVREKVKGITREKKDLRDYNEYMISKNNAMVAEMVKASIYL